jgi:hypothetical protein
MPVAVSVCLGTKVTRNFVDYAINKRRSETDGTAGLTVVEVLDAATASMRLNDSPIAVGKPAIRPHE